MTFRDSVQVLRERWILVLTAMILASSTAAVVWLLRPPEYTAILRMYVSAQSTDTAQAAFQGAQLSQQRVTSYVELVGSARVSEEVIRRLNLTTTPDELGQHITAVSKLDSVIIDVAVSGQSPENVAAVANAVGTVFPRLVDELERPSSPTGTPPVAVRVVQPAAVPENPSSAGLPITLALGFLAGAIIGVGGALVRNALDTSVKSPEQLRDIANVPNLGTVAFNSAVPKRPLTVQEDPQSPRSEAFRQLRTNLQFVNVDNPRKVIVITSSMPSEGKTTTLVNLAIAMASSEQRVLVIEADLRRPKLADVLGVERSVGLTSILAGQVKPEHAVQHWSGGTFDVLASGPLPPNPSELLASRHMASLLAQLRNNYDLILLDTPPLLPVTDAAAVAPATDGVVLVCRFKRTTRDQIRAAVAALEAVSAHLLGTVFSMVPAAGPRAYAQYNTYYQTEQAIASNAQSAVRSPVLSDRRSGTVDHEFLLRPAPSPSPIPRRHGTR